MTRYRVTRRAAADLRSIGRFTEERWGRTARSNYLQRIERAFRRLAANPSLGRSRPELLPVIKTFPVEKHLVIYRVETEGHIVVIRVVHQAMDYLDNP